MPPTALVADFGAPVLVTPFELTRAAEAGLGLAARPRHALGVAARQLVWDVKSRLSLTVLSAAR